MTDTTQKAADWKKYLPAGYRKRTVSVDYTEEVSLFGTEWDGGSRSVYTLCNADTGQVLPTPDAWRRSWSEPYKSHKLAADEVIVETGTFCGKASAARLHFHESRRPGALLSDLQEERESGL